MHISLTAAIQSSLGDASWRHKQRCKQGTSVTQQGLPLLLPVRENVLRCRVSPKLLTRKAELVLTHPALD